jgi:hypothetical protein
MDSVNLPIPTNSPPLPPSLSLSDDAYCPGRLSRQTTECVNTSEWHKYRGNMITATDGDMIMMTKNGPTKIGAAKLGAAKLGPGLVSIISDAEKINALEKTCSRQKEQINRLQSCVNQLIGILHDYKYVSDEYLNTFDKVLSGENHEFIASYEECKFDEQVRRNKESEEFQKARLKSENSYEYMYELNESEKDINLTFEQLENKYGPLTLHDKSYVDKDGYVRRIDDTSLNKEYSFMMQYNYMTYKDDEDEK